MKARKKKRARRTGKPGREVGLAVHEYVRVANDLHHHRRTELVVDEIFVERIRDHLDVLWVIMNEVDRKQVLYRLGVSRGK